MNKCKISVWSRSRHSTSKPLGKSYRLRNRELITEDVSANASHVQVVDIESLNDLAFEIEFNMHDGHAFMTSGVPEDATITESKVTVKDSPKKGCLTRTKDDIEWRDNAGTYFVCDYDPDWSSAAPKNVKKIRQDLIRALKLANVDISELQMLAYPSSSSGFVRKSDGHSFDKGGRHLIFLVEDAGDLKRFKQMLFDYTTLAGCNYGAVSDAGYFLKRGIIDLAAISPTQPTFSGIPAYRKQGLTNVREQQSARRFGGDMVALDTKMVPDLTDVGKAQCRRFWEMERERLKPDIARKTREWYAERGKELAKHIPDASPEQIRVILEHRWSGHLVGSDVIILNGCKVTIAEILRNPDKYDGKTGPDPIEPGYRKGAQTCKFYMNRSNGRPMIYSQAHGGINYRLWHDAQSALRYLGEMDTSKAQAALKPVLHATRPNDNAEAESLLLELAKLLKTTKKALIKDYNSVLNRNIKAVSLFTDDLDHVNQNGSSRINDRAHIAAVQLISDEQSIHTDDDRVWRFNGKYHESVSDLYLGRKLRKNLSEQGWEDDSGLTRNTREAIAALKELTYARTPLNARETKKIINCQNGEVHFLADGIIKFRDHDPSSQLTSVLSINYDPKAKAPVFRKTLEQLFYPPAHERMKLRSKSAQEAYERNYRANAIVMADHLEELLAYFLIPDRWIPAWFIWIGGGSNGKTFLTKLLNLLLDDDAIESDRIQAFSKNDFGIERLIGKTMIIDDDLITGTKIPDGFVKK